MVVTLQWTCFLLSTGTKQTLWSERERERDSYLTQWKMPVFARAWFHKDGRKPLTPCRAQTLDLAPHKSVQQWHLWKLQEHVCVLRNRNEKGLSEKAGWHTVYIKMDSTYRLWYTLWLLFWKKKKKKTVLNLLQSNLYECLFYAWVIEPILSKTLERNKYE